MSNFLKRIILGLFSKEESFSKTQLIWHVVALLLIGLSAWWAYAGFIHVAKPDGIIIQKQKYDDVSNTPSTAAVSKQVIKNNDEAVRAYLNAALLQAEIYAFTNNGRYGGMCEPSETLYSLEGGILQYIKMVGATEVFCSNSDSVYMIEAKLPISGLFYCIDSTGASVEQKETREGKPNCRD